MRNSRYISSLFAAAAVLVAGPGAALALTLPGFEHAIPVEPQKLELGAAVAGGDSLVDGMAFARMGLVDDLDMALRLGLFSGLNGGSKGEAGFEVEGSPRFRFVRTEDTGFVDAAVVGNVSIAKSSHLFVLSVDPLFVASHHFEIDAHRQLYVSLGLGVAVAYLDVDGRGSDLQSGFVGAFGAGVDIIQNVRLSLEARLRDEIQRYGLAVSYFF